MRHFKRCGYMIFHPRRKVAAVSRGNGWGWTLRFDDATIFETLIDARKAANGLLRRSKNNKDYAENIIVQRVIRIVEIHTTDNRRVGNLSPASPLPVLSGAS